MRILLLNAPSGPSQQRVFPLGLGYIATAVGERHEVACFDANLVEDPFAELERVVARSKPEVVGLSLRNIDTTQSYNPHSCWPLFIRMVKQLRQHCPDAVLIAGGAGFSIFAESIMKRLPEIDLGVHLEGEESFPELLDALDHPGDVRGVYHRQDGQVLFSGPRPFLDFDTLPMPRRDILDLSAYEGLHAIGVQTKRGCAFDCMYCTYPFLSGRRLRLRSPESVGAELEMLCREHGRHEVFFADNVFNRPTSHAAAICQEVIRRKLDIRWTAYFTEEGITADFVRLALEAGCVKFTFSPDGNNDTTLERLGKGVSREQIEAAYTVIEEFPQARFGCGFIWNYPQVHSRDLRDLTSLLLRLLRSKNLAGISVSTMRILPNTRLHGIALAEKRVRPDDDLLHPVFYDPFPWKLVSMPINGLGKLLKMVDGMTRRSIFHRGS